MTHTLLKLSAFDKSIFWHGGESYIILGLLGVLLGMLVGWFTWRKYRGQADSLEESNKRLREIHRKMIDKQAQIDSVIEEL